jgi:DNA-binding transcriptional LysR family regulator
MLLGSTAQAGREIGVSQPAISRLLRDLEHQAGCELFDRRKGRLVPTVEAETLFQETHSFMSSYDSVARSLAEIRTQGGGQLRVAGTNAIAHGLLPKAISIFISAHPKISISLGITVRGEIRKWINEQLFDVAVAALPIEYPAEEMERLGSLPGVCVAPSNHRLSTKKSISAQDLKGEPYISLSTSTVARLHTDMLFDKLRVKRKMLIDAQTSAAACELVSYGLGVSVVDPFTAARFTGKQVTIRPFHPSIEFEYACLYPVRRARTRFSKDFVECTRKCFAEFEYPCAARP